MVEAQDTLRTNNEKELTERDLKQTKLSINIQPACRLKDGQEHEIRFLKIAPQNKQGHQVATITTLPNLYSTCKILSGIVLLLLESKYQLFQGLTREKLIIKK